MLYISIHALLAESDPQIKMMGAPVDNFYPRSPCGERQPQCCTDTTSADFYPRSPCGERRISTIFVGFSWDFYPRSPCGERHFDRDQQDGDRADFYPRSPCGERPKIPENGLSPVDFYPRSPCGERPKNTRDCATLPNFYPRSPCGERRYLCMYVHNLAHISIHALLAESDALRSPRIAFRVDFYPRSPCGERQAVSDLDNCY